MAFIDDYIDGKAPTPWEINPITPGATYTIVLKDLESVDNVTWDCDIRSDANSSVKISQFTAEVKTNHLLQRFDLYLTLDTEPSRAEIQALRRAYIALDAIYDGKRYPVAKGYQKVTGSSAINDAGDLDGSGPII